MSHVIDANANIFYGEDSPGMVKRSAVMAYGIVAYILGVAGLLWIILAMGGLAPVSLSELETSSIYSALLVDVGLIVIFGLQHSIMARQPFKKWITRYIPEATERATYMLATGFVSIGAIYFWQPLPGTIWAVENSPAQIALWIVYALGWGYLFISTFITNHFELMGLRQVYLYFRNKPYSDLAFTRKYMYSYSRHPMMLGFLIGMWSVPTMSATHFIMAVLLSLYIFAGMFFEERDLIKEFGKTYRQYKNDIATFIPGLY